MRRLVTTALALSAAVVLATWALALGGSSVLAQSDAELTPGYADRKFDHVAHADAELKKTGKASACAGACHEGVYADGDRGRPNKKEHARCQGCHTFTLDCGRRKRGEGLWCTPCHNSKTERCLPDGTLAAAAAVRPSFRVAEGERPGKVIAVYSHKVHARPGSATADQCAGCHGRLGERPGKPTPSLSGGHGFCSGCHERGATPKMTDCGSCHVLATSERGKAPVVRRGPATAYRAGAFDHSRHAARVGADGRSCLTCHANIGEAQRPDEVPMPTMQGCYVTCHDGKKAFDATGTTCTRCHNSGTPR